MATSVRGIKEVFHNWNYYQHVVDSFKPIIQAQGFRRILPNTVEHKSTLTRSLGVQSEIILKEMYYVHGKHDTDDSMVLRPKGTATVLRYMCGDSKVSVNSEQHKLWY